MDARRIAGWEDAGRDYSTWPGLDVKARELAGEYPTLGIGTGYVEGAGDDTDYAGRLWALLREGARPLKPKHDPEIVTRAVELVRAAGPSVDVRRLSFSMQRWAGWLARNGIPWPRLDSGVLDLSDDTFRQMARQYPAVAPIRELRHTLSKLRLNDLAVGPDGRNRCMLSAFQAKTGRNQPSNSRFIFGPSCWLRGLIQPPPGQAVAYVDWEQQEFGIAAALSGDKPMMEAYTSGDPYLTLAKQAGAVPPDATKATHPQQRVQFKVCALAVQYGMGGRSLAQSLGVPEAQGRELLRLHRQTYPEFWRWSEAAVNHAMLRSRLHTVFGWMVHVGAESNPRSLANFPMQANGAEMLRLACCLATERGIQVSVPRFTTPCLSTGPAARLRRWWPTPKRQWLRQAGWSWTVSSCGLTPRSSGGRSGTWTNAGRRCGRRSWGFQTRWRPTPPKRTCTTNDPLPVPPMPHPPSLMSCNTDIPLDPHRLRLPDSAWKMPGKRKRLPRHRQREEFLAGPVPLNWLCRACALRGKALAVAMALRFKAGMMKPKGTDPIAVTQTLLGRFGVKDRRTGYRALAALESAGLVSVARPRGRCPRVVILDCRKMEASEKEGD